MMEKEIYEMAAKSRLLEIEAAKQADKRQTATQIVIALLNSDGPFWTDQPDELVDFAYELTEKLYERKSEASQLNNSAQQTEEN